MEGVGVTSTSSYRNWVKFWLFEPHTHGIFYFVHYNCTVLCCNLIIGWLVQNQGDNTERTRLDYQRNHKIWPAWARWSRSVIKYIFVISQIQFAGFYFHDFKRQIWERALNFTIQAFSTWFYLFIFFILLNFLTDRDKIKQTNCILTLFHNTLNRMERTS